MKTTIKSINVSEKSREASILSKWMRNQQMTDEDNLRSSVQETEEGYDGFDFKELSLDTEYVSRETIKTMGSLKSFDTKLRCGVKIDMVKMMSYLSSIHEVRDIVYNNKWGIVVRTPERSNYPENVVISTIKDIIIEGINSQVNNCKVSCFSAYNNRLEKRDNIREKLYLIWSSAPEGSILAKTWAMIPTLNYDENNQVQGKSIPRASGAMEALYGRMTHDSVSTLSMAEGMAIKAELTANRVVITRLIKQQYEIIRCNNIPGWLKLDF